MNAKDILICESLTISFSAFIHKLEHSISLRAICLICVSQWQKTKWSKAVPEMYISYKSTKNPKSEVHRLTCRLMEYTEICVFQLWIIYNLNAEVSPCSKEKVTLTLGFWGHPENSYRIIISLCVFMWFCSVKGVAHVCCCLQNGQTKVTMDTPASYCTITNNFLLHEPRLYFCFLRHSAFQKKRQWVRVWGIHSWKKKKKDIVLKSRSEIFIHNLSLTA